MFVQSDESKKYNAVVQPLELLQLLLMPFDDARLLLGIIGKEKPAGRSGY